MNTTLLRNALLAGAGALIVGGACSDRDQHATAPRSGLRTGPSYSTSGSEVLRARVYINGLGGISGTVDFTQAPVTADFPEPTVDVVARISGDPEVLNPGYHGLHIHDNGLCEPPYTTAGGHLDPGPFGNSTPVDANHPYHMGDLPPLIVNEAGEGHMNTTTSRITLSEGPLSVYDLNGSTVVLHQNPDLGTPGVPFASGGPRIACGIIEPFEIITLP
jgi:Cu-Zn family superoxide dismutase